MVAKLCVVVFLLISPEKLIVFSKLLGAFLSHFMVNLKMKNIFSLEKILLIENDK